MGTWGLRRGCKLAAAGSFEGGLDQIWDSAVRKSFAVAGRMGCSLRIAQDLRRIG